MCVYKHWLKKMADIVLFFAIQVEWNWKKFTPVCIRIYDAFGLSSVGGSDSRRAQVDDIKAFQAWGNESHLLLMNGGTEMWKATPLHLR